MMSSGITLKETVDVSIGGGFAEFSIGQPWTANPSSGPEPETHYLHYGFRDDIDVDKLSQFQSRFPGLSPALWPSVEETIEEIAKYMHGKQQLTSMDNNISTVIFGCTGHGRMVQRLRDEPRLVAAHREMLSRAWPGTLAMMERKNARSRDASMANAREFRDGGYPAHWVKNAVCCARVSQRRVIGWRRAYRDAQLILQQG